MSPIVSTIEIACPPHEVFCYVTDPSRFGEWQDDVVKVHMAGGGPARVGSRFTTTRRIGRAERTMTQEITEITAPRGWAAYGVDGPIRPNVTVAVQPLNDGAWSKVVITLDFEGHGIGELLVPMVRRLAAKGSPASYRNLKEQLESGPR